MRIIFIWAMIILSLHSFSQNFENLSFGTDSTLDIISWNVENFPKNGSTSVNSLSQAIEALDADIYAFQEIGDTDEFISIMNGMPQYEYSIGDWYYTALVIVYKPAIIQNANLHEIYTSSAYWNPFPRSPFVIEFTSMGYDYAVINNHLKCCGDGYLELDNEDDEEYRRYLACSLLKQYIDDNLNNSRVLLVGDLNDELDDNASNNVFQSFINDASNFRFDDMDIANGDDSNWSYPSYPSHLDHILISNELFNIADHPASTCEVIKVDNIYSSWWDYDNNLSDHRPVGIKLYPGTGLLAETNKTTVFNLFPNPVHDEIHISSMQPILSVKIYDSNGELVLSEQADSNRIKINLSGLSRGMYVIRIEESTNRQIRQIIKL